ncbi:MAG: hypothetical protein KJN89_00465 [Gammaproteobacteria bacterium]|nr:hypothetical protein [Gammaproteobacteria bacterium]MBT8135264.1 hypothetical protein [Gammaproteobacteria bacterium]NNJ48812.1 hypothetical protein [Gammaproteobacteria bacterium]
MSAQAQQQSPGKTTKQKNARPMAGHQRWNRIGDAGSDGPQKGRERAYAGLQRIHKNHFRAIKKTLIKQIVASVIMIKDYTVNMSKLCGEKPWKVAKKPTNGSHAAS